MPFRRSGTRSTALRASIRTRPERAAWQFLLDENVDPKVATYLAKENLDAVHVRDTLGQGADDEADVLPYAREKARIVVTSDVTDFGALPREAHAGIILLYDDTMPAYRVASALITMVDTYPSREAFTGLEELDAWL
jgi:predicted nuclease of predicted toxin-antitoxin system